MDFSSIKSIREMEYISKEVIWQNFEKLTGFIFEQNNYEVQVNKVLTKDKKKRRQFDVIAKKSNLTYLVDCKKWVGHRYRLSGIKAAIRKHKERTEFYNKLKNTKAIPIIVTLIEEEIQSYKDVYIIPILKLNSFLQQV